jgi:hypothetical protein
MQMIETGRKEQRPAGTKAHRAPQREYQPRGYHPAKRDHQEDIPNGRDTGYRL